MERVPGEAQQVRHKGDGTAEGCVSSLKRCKHGHPLGVDCLDCYWEQQALDDEIVQSAALVHRREYPSVARRETPALRRLWALLDRVTL